jgi:hypothetical protein
VRAYKVIEGGVIVGTQISYKRSLNLPGHKVNFRATSAELVISKDGIIPGTIEINEVAIVLTGNYNRDKAVLGEWLIGLVDDREG